VLSASARQKTTTILIIDLHFIFSFFKICIPARLLSMCGDGSPLSYTACRSEGSVGSFGLAGTYCRPLLDKVGKNNGGIVLLVIAPAQRQSSRRAGVFEK
jgi:hypothetical protein